MTNSSPAGGDHWSVSTRAHGGIVTAGVTLPSIEMALLGIPPGFTPPEIQNWLKDLAGVAIETSRTDERTRPIPQLLHHALTGLLFSQTELWSHTGHPLPCAAVFVDGPLGLGFGWVGRARVVLLVNGEPYEPQWVIVRDEAGQEAMSASLPSDAHVLLTLEYWPGEEGMGQAPALLDAEFGQPEPDAPRAIEPAPAAAPAPQPATVDVPRAAPRERVSSRERETPLPPTLPREMELGEPPARSPSGRHEILPMQQPGLANDPTGMRLGGTESEQVLPSTRHPSSSTFAMPRLPGMESGAHEGPIDEGERRVSGLRDDADTDEAGLESDEPGHPVGRWLARIVSGFGRKRADDMPTISPRESAPERASRPAPPLAHPPERRVVPPQRMGAPQPAADIEEPHALPPGAGEAPILRPVAPAPDTSGRGLTPAGFGEIFGAAAPQTPARRRGDLSPPTQPAVPAPPAARATPETAAPGEQRAPLHAWRETKPPAADPSGIQIEREPVRADSTFAIPKLPQREAPKPAPKHVPPGSAPPILSAPGQRRPAPGTSGPAGPPAVPEPPAEFLEQFAASMRSGPGLDPAPAEPVPPRESAPPAKGVRPGAPPTLAAGQRAAQPPQPQAQPQPQRPVIPAVPPSRAAAQASAAHAPAAQDPAAKAPAAKAPAPRTPAAPAGAPPAQVKPPQPARSAPLAEAPDFEVGATRMPPVLRPPTPPAPVAESDLVVQFRDIPMSARREIPDSEIPDGMLVARPSSRPLRPMRSGPWPDLDELERPRPLWRNPWVAGVVVALLLGVGWLVGQSQAPDNDVHATPMNRVLRTFGMGGARFTASIDSDPPGAWITVDGKDLGRRTPSTLELIPGPHTVTLSMPDLGQVEAQVRGRRGQSVKVSELLHGSLDVVASDPSLPVQMSLDGAPQGYLPVHVSKLPPGLHELQFSGPRMQAWAQNVNVLIRKNTKVVSKPVITPATGVVQVQAQMNDENGASTLSGASVYVDGDLRGTTPSTIELPRGPHSLRVQFEGVVAPIQVIDLPGGNRRFAMFQFGLDSDLPPLKLQGSFGNILSKQPAVVSASLDGLEADDLREAWLHVRKPDGLWNRYQATIEAGARGAVITVNFPASLFNGEERVNWYMSASTKQGDDFFTEMQRSGR